MDFKELYEKKLTTAEKAAEVVNPETGSTMAGVPIHRLPSMLL